ncbi:hypothetical protein BLNAU_24068 [Blattamonas nauphoetae]|uniref:DUF4371 domain-containing protein n=1 Tax=Blattamonas nauphoetae TaxID=2049346 RepID=A0ABQ9WNG3_9EUKA|nr:hypothetical protein BLNAU_24068 [Blattamonas nauphoetae]
MSIMSSKQLTLTQFYMYLEKKREEAKNHQELEAPFVENESDQNPLTTQIAPDGDDETPENGTTDTTPPILSPSEKVAHLKAFFAAFAASSIRNQFSVTVLCVNVRVATDGDQSMVGLQKGFIACICAKVPSLLRFHCVAHKFQLVLKDAFDNEAHPISHELIKNTILLIHSITKPINVRWSTVGKSISETLQYLPIILHVHKDETDAKLVSLRDFFQLPHSLLHLSALNLILAQTNITSTILQSHSLTFSLAQNAINELESRLAATTTSEISTRLVDDMKTLGVVEYNQVLNSTIEDCQAMIVELRNWLKSRFSIPDDSADLDFVIEWMSKIVFLISSCEIG